MSGFTYSSELTTPGPSDGTSAGRGDDLILQLKAVFDNQLAPDLSGAFADRPAFGIPGRTWTAIDTGGIYIDNGTAWVGPLVQSTDWRLNPMQASSYAAPTTDPSTNYDPHDPRCQLVAPDNGAYFCEYGAIVASTGSNGVGVGLILVNDGGGVTENVNNPRPTVTSPNGFTPVSIVGTRSLLIAKGKTVSVMHAAQASGTQGYKISNRWLKITRFA